MESLKRKQTECIKFSDDFLKKTSRPDLKSFELYIFNLLDKSSREKGMQMLKMISHARQQVTKVIAGGGDGTVMWVVHEMVNHHIDMNKVAVGVLPFGTGNDFSRVTGWGPGEDPKLKSKPMQVLKGLAKDWLESEVDDFDLWDAEMTLHEHGEFAIVHKANGKVSKVPLKNEDGSKKLVFKKTFSNYASFGVDARIGFGFEKNRTTSRVRNKCVYAWEGFKKMCLRTTTMNKLIHKMAIAQKSEMEAKHGNEDGTNHPSQKDISLAMKEGNDTCMIFKSPESIKKEGKHPLDSSSSQNGERIEKYKKNQKMTSC